MWPGDCPRSDLVDRIDAGLSALYLGFDLGGTNIRTAVARVLGDSATLLGRDTRAHCVYDLDGHPSQISLGALLETMTLAATRFSLGAERAA